MHQEASALGIAAPQLRISDEVGAPFVAGLLAPAVVLPEVLLSALDEGELALVLRHELVHLRRRDLHVAALVAACAALFTGHPTARRLVREIHLAREAAVDAEVARADPHAYATLLVDVASLAGSGEKLAHVSMDDTALTRRIAMLTQRKTNEPSGRRRAILFAAATVAGIGLGAPAVLADPPNKIYFGKADGPRPHQDEINACFEAARRENPRLVVDTTARLEIDRDGKVLSASVPVPEAPSFQRCVEERAMGWTFPVPPLPPGGQKPADAKLQFMLRLLLPAALPQK
jgi:BlaR1 peptidase M56